MQSIWDQSEQSAHIVKDLADATILATKQDQFRLIQFLMALTSEYEPVRAALLQQVPLPTLEFAMSQLLSHETRLRTLQPHHPNAVLATTARHPGMVRNTAKIVISRDIFCLNARPFNVGIVTRLVILCTTTLPSQVN
jgi:hypothetical protein